MFRVDFSDFKILRITRTPRFETGLKQITYRYPGVPFGIEIAGMSYSDPVFPKQIILALQLGIGIGIRFVISTFGYILQLYK